MGKDITNLTTADKLIFSTAIDLAGGDPTARTALIPVVRHTNEMQAWAAGTELDGPNSNGTYPVTLINGTVVNIPTLRKLTASTGIAASGLNIYGNNAKNYVPLGLLQSGVGAITGGSGGANGTFALTWSGGNFAINPTGTFTVAGGVVTAVNITGPGQYIGSSPTVPTPGFGGSTGLTGAAVVLTSQVLVTSGNGYWVQSADGLSLIRYLNNSGTATIDATISSIPTTAAIQGFIDFPAALIALSNTKTAVNAQAAQVSSDSANVTAKTALVLQYKADTAALRDQVQVLVAAVDTAAIASAKTSTAADRVDVAANRAVVDSSAVSAQNNANLAKAAAESSGNIKFYATKAELTGTVITALADQQIVEILTDESLNGQRTRYRKESGAFAFKMVLPKTLAFYAHSTLGNDANDGLSPQRPVKTLVRLRAVWGGYTDLYNNSPSIGADVYLMRGSHWYGEYLTGVPPFAKVGACGQGDYPIIDGAMNLFIGTWTYSATWDAWYQDIVLPQAIQGGYPSANSWNPGLWPDTVFSRVTDDGLPRILNGDAMPDAAYDPTKPQTTTIAQTSQNGLLAILRDSPIGGFTVFKSGSTSYEPRSPAVEYVDTNFRVWMRDPKWPDPNAAGHPTYRIQDMSGLANLSQGCDVSEIVFARNGGKDMVSGNFNNVSGAVLPTIGSGQFTDCGFLAFSVHGQVAGGMNNVRCRAIGSYTRMSHKQAGGAYHQFRSQGSQVGTSEGYRNEGCSAERCGVPIYSHGSTGTAPDGTTFEHDHADIRGLRANDVLSLFAAGTNRKPINVSDCFATNVDDIGVLSGGTMRRSRVFGRLGNRLALGTGSPGDTVTLIDTLIAGTTIGLLDIGINATIDPATYPTLNMTRSAIVGTLFNPGSAIRSQMNLAMRDSYIGTFDGGGQRDDMFILGTIKTTGSNVIECVSQSIDSLRTLYPGITSGTETGLRRQTWTKTITASDLDFTSTSNFTATYNGTPDSGGASATIVTSYNYGVMYRGVRFVDAYGTGQHYDGIMLSNPDSSHIIVRPAPTAAFTNKNVVEAKLSPVMRDAVTAYISTDGLRLNVPDGTRFTVGLYVGMGSIRKSAAAFGLRKIVGITGNILTLDQPCNWTAQAPTSRYYNDIATPTGYSVPLPTVRISWGWSFVPPHLGGYAYPAYSLAKAEGGTTSTVAGYDCRDCDWENGYWAGAVPAGIGDVLTLVAEADIPELRLQLAAPVMSGVFLPKPECFVGKTGIGFTRN